MCDISECVTSCIAIDKFTPTMTSTSISCAKCHKVLTVVSNKNWTIESRDNVITVSQYALPGIPQNTPALCNNCVGDLRKMRPANELCYVCETQPSDPRYEFFVSWMYINMDVYTSLCSAKCRAKHEIFAHEDFAENGGHFQIINNPVLFTEIETEKQRLRSTDSGVIIASYPGHPLIYGPKFTYSQMVGSRKWLFGDDIGIPYHRQDMITHHIQM
jgi:hypothetical protein